MYIQWKHFHFWENEKTLVFPINYNWWRKQKELSEVKWMKSPWVQIERLFYYREKHANINSSCLNQPHLNNERGNGALSFEVVIFVYPFKFILSHEMRPWLSGF